MAASKPNANARVRFSTSDDLALLREVLGAGAVSDCSRWPEVISRLCFTTRAGGQDKQFTVLAVRDRFDLMLSQFSTGDAANLKK
ncbi:hypothetical protein HPB49_026008 [Dermacentor silvarum]|nr:hypothetical protein HPB49_026008 [Dermacentor silvarum]